MLRLLFASLALLGFTTAVVADQPPQDDPSHVIVLEVRVVKMPADAGIVGMPAKEGDSAFLSNAELKSFLEAVNGNPRSHVVQAPKATTDDGQEIVVKTTQQESFVTNLEVQRVKGQAVLVPKPTTIETGMKFVLRGRASEDKKTVAVSMEFTNTWVDEKLERIPVMTRIPSAEAGSRGKPIVFTQYLESPQVETERVAKRDLAIPAGGHAMIAGPTFAQESRVEMSTSYLGKIPYVNRLFKNVGISKTTMRTMLIVSATVIENN